MPHDARIGVVLATRNRAALLKGTLVHLLAIPEHPRVIVVDNGSTDDTVDVASAFGPPVEVIRLPENLGAAARNVGVLQLDCNYVAFADDDSWYAPGALTRAAELFDAHPKLALIAARILVGPEESLDPTCAAMATSPLPRTSALPGPAVLGFLACGAVVRRSAFLGAGGFSTRFGIGGEEKPLAIDLACAGWELAYIEAITAYHHPPPRQDQNLRRRILVRNALWTIWLRMRAPGALWHTMRTIGRNCVDRVGRTGIYDALRDLPAILRDRQPVPRELDQLLRQID